jgi:hypothetical protein
MRGLSGASDDPTLDDMVQRNFRFASDEGEGLTAGDQSPAPAGTPTGGTPSQPVPQLWIESERRSSILDNTPGEFSIAANPEASPSPPFHAVPAEGIVAVREHA